MTNDGRDISIQQTRKREDMEVYEEEAMRFLPLLVQFFVMLVGIYFHRKYFVREPLRSEIEEGIYQRRLWMGSLAQESKCILELHINTHGHSKLCNILCDEGGLVVTRNVTVREVVALFLHILAHDLKNRTIKNVFAHSGETISRQFNSVLKAILKIGKKYIKQDHAVLHEGDDRWKWFKGALGALDSTHVPLIVPIEDQGRY